MVVPRKIWSDKGTETVDTFVAHRTFHTFNDNSVPEDCWKYGRSVHNQKVECFWSQFIKQWLLRWRETLLDLKDSELWIFQNENDRIALLYIYMPLIQKELFLFRKEYNSFSIRRNHLSRLPCGPPEDNYLIETGHADFSISIDPAWINMIREETLHDFDCEEYLSPDTVAYLDLVMVDRPLGTEVNLGNARRQYVFLRNYLHEEDRDLL